MTTTSASLEPAAIKLKSGQVYEAVAETVKIVKSFPEDLASRTLLFQLFCITLDWERAKKQLNLLTKLNPEILGFASLYSEAIHSEKTRAAVFAASVRPAVLGEPPNWVALMSEALQVEVSGFDEKARELRKEALNLAPSSSGTINQERFSWISDVDGRIGPALEVFVEGDYHWLPFEYIQTIVLDKPDQLHDTIWAPARVTLRNEGEFALLIPTRYPVTSDMVGELHLLGRQTDWLETAPDQVIGIGQRMLATDKTDYPLLEITEINFHSV